ncbi:MAG: hypothetical protein HYS22_08420 [Deltaproteobacteria bacterium]|nr:hypothetical protein [Deltaproteobacteria bacterium]
MKVSPFPFERLPKVSRQEIQLFSTLFRSLDKFGFDENCKRGLESLLLGHLGLPVSLSLRKAEIAPFGKVMDSVNPHGVFVLFTLSPAPGRILLEIDPSLASSCIDCLLGGSHEKADPSRIGVTDKKPTEMDQGVLSYLFLKILSFLDQYGQSMGLHFRLDRFETEKTAVAAPGQDPNPVASFFFRINFNDQNRFVRLILPSSLIQKLDSQAGEPMTEKEADSLLERMDRLGFLKTQIWAEAGKTSLALSDIEKLEAGDVVLLDETTVQFAPERGIAGDVIIHAGQGSKRIGIFSPIVASNRSDHPRKLMVRLEKVVETYEG